MDNDTVFIVLAILLAISEALALIPALKSNGILQLIVVALRAVCTITKKQEEK